MIKGSLHQKNTVILNVFTPNHRAPKFMKIQLIELREETDKSIIIFWIFNAPLSQLIE